MPVVAIKVGALIASFVAGGLTGSVLTFGAVEGADKVGTFFRWGAIGLGVYIVGKATKVI
jgi:hypothetical protein